MNNLTRKQKIIIVVIISVVSIFCYYIYSKNNKDIIIDNEEMENISKENETNKDIVEEKESKIIVHISGAIKNEGIVELNEGSRIADAIEKAGGLKESANTKEINLAFKLEDGMKIYIPIIGEDINNNVILSSEVDSTEKYITSSGGNGGSVKKSQVEEDNSKNEKININTAVESELDSLPGIGLATAQKIIAYREEIGRFKSIEDIKEVSGIGDSKFEKIKDKICVGY